MEISRKYSRCFKQVLRKFKGTLKVVFYEEGQCFLKGVSMKFREC